LRLSQLWSGSRDGREVCNSYQAAGHFRNRPARDAIRCTLGRTPGQQPPPSLVQSKLDMIDFAMNRLRVQSFADLGGVWGVEAGYTFYALAHGARTGVLVDTHLTDAVLDKARGCLQLRVVRGNFGADAIAAEVGDVDAVFLFDTLLHQVAPDWDRILDLYSRQARCFLIYNQQWIGPGRRVRLLDLGEDEYFRNAPQLRDEGPTLACSPTRRSASRARRQTVRDVHRIWQWGITDADLLAKMQDLGYRFRFFVNDGRFGSLKSFENHAFVFSRIPRPVVTPDGPNVREDPAVAPSGVWLSDAGSRNRTHDQRFTN